MTKFIKYFTILNLLLIVSLYAKTNNKVKVYVFANEESCWTCLKGIDVISKIGSKNINLEITLYFCNESQELLNSLLKDYKIDLQKVNTFLDPLCLYAKNYNLSFLPAIIIKDLQDSIVLKEQWGNPQQYVQLIQKIDNDFITNNSYNNNNFIEGLKFIKSLILKDIDQKEIFNNFFSGFYNYNNNQYYGIIGKDTNLYVFDSNGVAIDKINIKQEGVVCFMPLSVQLGNDTNIIWSDLSTATQERFYYSLNLHTKLVNRKIKPNKIDGVAPRFNFIQIFNTNKLVVAFGYQHNVYLNNESKLLSMVDEKDSVSRYFGHIDSILSNLKMSCFMWNSAEIASDNSSNIYSLSPLSNELAMYDKDGNYNKTIILDFTDGFLEKPIDLPKDIQYTENMMEVYLNYKNLYKLFVLDNDIFVVHNILVPNAEEFKYRDKKYWLTHFDKNGKRVGNTIQLPNNYQPIHIKDNKILIQRLDASTGKIFLYWYEIL